MDIVQCNSSDKKSEETGEQWRAVCADGDMEMGSTKGRSMMTFGDDYDDDEDEADILMDMEAWHRMRGRKQGLASRLALWPTPLCNFFAMLFAVLSVALGVAVLVMSGGSGEQCVVGYGEKIAAPGATTSAEEAAERSTRWKDFRGRPLEVASEDGIVASDQGVCSHLGTGTLQAGGNAVDAAVTTALCLGVVNPGSSGMGGGGFMLIRTAQGAECVIDMREEAPASASQDMYNADPREAQRGGTSIAVPLELKGLHEAWKRYGSLEWKSVVEPVIPLAGGWIVGPYLAGSIQYHWKDMREDTLMASVFGKEDGSPLKMGDVAKNERLQKTLEEVASIGPDALYGGVAVKKLAAEIQSAGGYVTEDDLRGIKPIVKSPLKGEAFGYEILMVPPPSSGALQLFMLRLLDLVSTPFPGMSSSLRTHYIIEAMKHAFSLRLRFKDEGTVDHRFPGGEEALQAALNQTFAEEIFSNIRENATLAVEEYGGKFSIKEDHGTSHFSILDGEGTAVSMTTTVNYGFGSMVMSNSTGIVFNNQMDDFSIPGVSNGYGLAPSEANFIAPRKKPLSSMSPTIVLRDGSVKAVTGASGGPRIITSTLQTLIQMLLFGKKPLAALLEPRVHSQLYPNHVDYEKGSICLGEGDVLNVPDTIVEGLIGRGHQVEAKTTQKCVSRFGVSQAIVVDFDTNVRFGASDPRKGGAPSGL